MTLYDLLDMNDYILNRYKDVKINVYFDSNHKFILEASCNFMNIDVDLSRLRGEIDMTCFHVGLSIVE